MKFTRILAAGAATLAAAALGTSAIAADLSQGVPAEADRPQQAATADIVDTAIAAGSFTTLVTAVQAAGLEETLRSAGPFTVFAPTDAAFAALPAGTLEALLADPATLADILLYHVVPGDVRAADVVGLTSATAANGDAIGISVVNGGVVLNGSSNVTATDVLATNGVIHVIDAVILPPADAVPAPAAAGNAAPTEAGSTAPWMALGLLGIVAAGLGTARFVTARSRA
ncbi:MAG: hypothetical protein AMXMBFR23_17650 [Chloroflexota bacterium]